MSTLTLTKDNFESTINNNDIIIVDYWASWCGPCVGFAPVFEKASEKYPQIVFAKVNTEEEQEIAGSFGIRSIPTIMVFRENVMLYNEAGALSAPAFEKLIEQILEVDMEHVHSELAKQQAEKADEGDGDPSKGLPN